MSKPDLTAFPLVSLNVRSAGFESVPLASFDGLSVRENGIPIAEVSLTSIPVGMDAVFVLDANETAQFVDIEGDVNRVGKMQASINRFGARFMNPSGLDTISVVVPDSSHENGRLLINAITAPEQIDPGFANWTPTYPATAPLNEMMLVAMDHLSDLQTSNRFQAILLMSDAGRLDELLNTSGIVEQAQNNNIAIFVAIVGSGASFEEIENAAALYQPTNGFFTPLPNSADTDPIYLIWQRQSNQVQVQYQSLVRENGRYPLSINVGQANASSEFELNLQSPEITLALENDAIRRVGTAVDTPLENLVPAVQPIDITVSWPDNIERTFEAVQLFANNQPATLLDEPAQVGNQLQVRWDVSTVEAGAYELYVEVTDSLGKTAASDTRLISIITEWPDPPTPTPAPTPTATPTPTLTENIRREVNLVGWFGGALVILMGLILLPLVLRRRNNRQASRYQNNQSEPPPIAPFPDVLEREHTAVLAPVSPNAKQLVLSEDNVSIGRLAGNTTLQIPDRSISTLHARIRWQNGRYWLYDEGSDTGTYLNEERLGLRPAPLSEGDTIRLGRLIYQFLLYPLGFEEE
ncbi:MAG: FHA domain-containing protein [Chloroflexota bacterium]